MIELIIKIKARKRLDCLKKLRMFCMMKLVTEERVSGKWMKPQIARKMGEGEVIMLHN
jgi:hypothetical protein